MAGTSYPDRLQEIIQDVVLQTRVVLDPEAILMAGSFGKESWMFADALLLSDFEFVFVCKKRWSLKQKRQLQKRLNSRHKYSISLKGFLLKNVQKKVISNYASSYPGYLSLSFFDAFKEPVILFQESREVVGLPELNICEVPAWEAWKLFVNRLGDLLDSNAYKRITTPEDKFRWLKIFESAADGFLLTQKSYTPNINTRLDTLSPAMLEKENALPAICKEAYLLLKMSLAARKMHDLSLFSPAHNTDHLQQVTLAWLNYFQSCIVKEEGLNRNQGDCFYDSYLAQKGLQRKYLELAGKFNKQKSNVIRLAYNPGLIRAGLKYYNFHISWRHIILLGLSALYVDHVNCDSTYVLSRKILGKIVRKKKLGSLDGDALMKQVIILWKTLR